MTCDLGATKATLVNGAPALVVWWSAPFAARQPLRNRGRRFHGASFTTQPPSFAHNQGTPGQPRRLAPGVPAAGRALVLPKEATGSLALINKATLLNHGDDRRRRHTGYDDAACCLLRPSATKATLVNPESEHSHSRQGAQDNLGQPL